jgi:hypothetical protein
LPQVNRGFGALLVVCGLAAAGCGADSKSYSDGEISDGLALRPDGREYLVATKEEPKGDAFCIVTELLNDADEVEQAPDGAARQALSSREGNAGVVVSTELGFPCEEEVARNLNRLDPKPKEE